MRARPGFAEDLTQLLSVLTFLFFGVTMVGPALGAVSWGTALYVVLSLTAIRMLPVARSLRGTGLHRTTVLFLGWFGPHGLAPILFALILIEGSDLPDNDTITDIVTWTVLVSIVAHGLTALPFARAYGSATWRDPEERAVESASVAEMPERTFSLDFRPDRGADDP